MTYVVALGAQRLNAGGGDFGRLHGRRGVEGHVVGGDLDVRFQLFVKVARAVAVPEKGDVPELLRLAARKGAHAVLGQPLRRHLGDGGRRHKVVLGQVQVAIVLHHAHELGLRHALAVKGGELASLGVLESLAELNHAVSAEVEQHNGVAVLNRAHRLVVAVHDGERRQVLVIRVDLRHVHTSVRSPHILRLALFRLKRTLRSSLMASMGLCGAPGARGAT